jgi:hypothetical protein
MNKIIVIVLLLFYFQSFGQSKARIDENFPYALLSKPFENLNHYPGLLEKYPNLKDTGFYTILGCLVLLSTEEEEVRQIGKARLQEIATQLFREQTPVLLISGLDSASRAEKENENLNDDNNLIYISITDCVISQEVQILQEIFNSKTRSLLTQK